MHFRKTPLAIAVLTAPILSACGGGGDSGNTIAFTNFSDSPDNGTVRLEGRANTTNFTVNSNTGELTLSAVETGEDARLDLERSDGETTDVIGSAGDVDVSFNTTESPFTDLGDDLVELVSPDGEQVAVHGIGTGSLDYEHQTFGVWIDGFNSNQGSVAAASVGSRTDAANLPGNTASFSGQTVGLAQLSDGDTYLADSDLTVTTSDFRTLNIESTNTIVENLDTFALRSESDLNFTGTATVSGAGFTGTITGTAVNGNIDGNFFGPNAEEVGGVFDSQSGSTTYIGSFGAVRD